MHLKEAVGEGNRPPCNGDLEGKKQRRGKLAQTEAKEKKERKMFTRGVKACWEGNTPSTSGDCFNRETIQSDITTGELTTPHVHEK